MGEKWDGMRCCWNPFEMKLYSKTGIELPFPDYLKNHMPNEFLDAEIWYF